MPSKPRFVKVNTLMLTVEEVVNGFREEGWKLIHYTEKSNYKNFLLKIGSLKYDEFIVDIHCPEVLSFPPQTEFFRHAAYLNGSIILQDKVSFNLCLTTFGMFCENVII